MSSSSDSDSDEEEKKKLAESLSGVSFGYKTQEKKVIQKKKSLRNFQDNEEQTNILQTTPEFRKFIAKKLDSFFEREILDETVKGSEAEKSGHVAEENGIKLFTSSFLCLNNLDDADEQKQKQKKKKKRKVSTSSSEEDDESLQRLKAAAVTLDFIAKEAANFMPQEFESELKPKKQCNVDNDDESTRTKKKKKKKKKKRVEEIEGVT